MLNGLALCCGRVHVCWGWIWQRYCYHFSVWFLTFGLLVIICLFFSIICQCDVSLLSIWSSWFVSDCYHWMEWLSTFVSVICINFQYEFDHFSVNVILIICWALWFASFCQCDFLSLSVWLWWFVVILIICQWLSSFDGMIVNICQGDLDHFSVSVILIICRCDLHNFVSVIFFIIVISLWFQWFVWFSIICQWDFKHLSVWLPKFND